MNREEHELNRDSINYTFGPEREQERVVNEKIVDGFLAKLVEYGFITPPPTADWRAFHSWQQKINASFDVPMSSITTRTARLLFALARAENPRTVVCIGSAWGNALVWLAVGAPQSRCLGVDIDRHACNIASRNFASIGRAATFLVKDAREASSLLPEIDLLLLDADDAVSNKAILAPILESLRTNLSCNCLVLAHDASLQKFKNDFKSYRSALDKLGFQKTIAIPVDDCGLEVSRL